MRFESLSALLVLLGSLLLHVVCELVLYALALVVGALIGMVPVIFVVRLLSILPIDEALEVLVLSSAVLQVLVEVTRRVPELVQFRSYCKGKMLDDADNDKDLLSSPGLMIL